MNLIILGGLRPTRQAPISPVRSDAVALIMCPDLISNAISPKRVELQGVDSLLYLERPLAKAGLKPVVINPYYSQRSSPWEILEDVRAAQPGAIGISAPSHLLDDAALLASYLYAQTGLPVVMGGYICLLEKMFGAEGLMQRLGGVTVLFKGEGEERAPLVFKALQNPQAGPSLSQIPGLLWRDTQGRVVDTGIAPHIHNVDDLIPDPERLAGFPKQHVDIYAMRGCSYDCSFCEIPDFQGHRLRRMSGTALNNLILELKDKWDRAGAPPSSRKIFFTDDNFLNGRAVSPEQFEAGQRGRIDEIADTLLRTETKIQFQTRATDVWRNRGEILRNKDVFSQIHMGIESFAATQLERWRKRSTPEDNWKAIRFLSEAGITYVCYMVLLDGETTFEEVLRNAEGILSLPPSGGIPYLIRAFGTGYAANVYQDILGRRPDLPKGIQRHHELMCESVALFPFADFYAWHKYTEPKYRALLVKGAEVLLKTGALAAEDSEAGLMAQRLNRRLILAIHNFWDGMNRIYARFTEQHQEPPSDLKPVQEMMIHADHHHLETLLTQFGMLFTAAEALWEKHPQIRRLRDLREPFTS